MASTRIKVRLVTDFGELDPLREQWNALAHRSETATVYQTFEWFAAWWLSFGGGGSLLVFLAYEADGLAGLAPLCIRKRRVNGVAEDVVHFIGAENFAADYCDFLVPGERPDILVELLHAICNERPRWTVLDLSNVPSHSRHVERTAEFFSTIGLPVISRTLCDAPACVFGTREDSKKLVNKKSLKRHYNYFVRNGILVFKHCDTEHEIRHYFDAFFEQHVRRWAKTATPSMFLSDRNRSFYRTLVGVLHPTGWLRFAVLLYNEEPLAFHLGFEYKGRFLWYKPTFNPEYSKKSPGEVLLKLLLEYAISKGLDEFDFTAGGEAFKYRFANTIRTNTRVRVYASRRSFLIEQLRRRLGAIKRVMLRKTPE